MFKSKGRKILRLFDLKSECKQDWQQDSTKLLTSERG